MLFYHFWWKVGRHSKHCSSYYNVSCFFLAKLSRFFLYCQSSPLIMCLCMVIFIFILLEDYWNCWICKFMLLGKFREIFNHYFLQIFVYQLSVRSSATSLKAFVANIGFFFFFQLFFFSLCSSDWITSIDIF